MKKAAILFTALVLLSGCGVDVSEFEKKVLERDPSFESVIDTKNSTEKDIEETHRIYLNKKRNIEGQITALKQELEKSRGEYISRMERLKKKLDPEVTALKNEIKMMKTALAVKTAEVSMVEKSIEEIKELMHKGKTLEMTQEEMRMWNERMTALVKKREDAVRDRDKAALDIETANLKIRIITKR